MISPELTEAPPELTRTAVYPMRTQRNALRVAYAVAPDAFAVAALSDALATAVADGVGLALRLDAEGTAVGAAAVAAVAAGTVGDGGEGGDDSVLTAVTTAAWGHSLSRE